MIYKPTVLILGAGASKPFGFPLGDELSEIIVKLNNDSADKELLIAMGYDKKKIQDFTKALAGADVTIDRFLELNYDNYSDIGKAAISIVLLQSENENNLRVDDWHRLLWRAINDAPLHMFGDNRISVITYNYDRSLEHYLFTRLCSLYPGEPEDKVALQLSRINIIHLHGQTGYLPWQKGYNEQVKYPYGGIKHTLDKHNDDSSEEEQNEILLIENAKKLNAISKGIKIVNEDISSKNSSITTNLLDNADKIYFLGFGYHEANLDRLNLLSYKDRGKTILGSAYKLGPPFISNIENRLERVLQLGPSSEDSLTFLRQHVLFE